MWGFPGTCPGDAGRSAPLATCVHGPHGLLERHTHLPSYTPGDKSWRGAVEFPSGGYFHASSRSISLADCRSAQMSGHRLVCLSAPPAAPPQTRPSDCHWGPRSTWLGAVDPTSLVPVLRGPLPTRKCSLMTSAPFHSAGVCCPPNLLPVLRLLFLSPLRAQVSSLPSPHAPPGSGSHQLSSSFFIVF